MPTILLIDDDPNDEELATVALEQMGIKHRLEVKRDGAEALAWISTLEGPSNSHWPKLILLDLKLPKVNGLEVLDRIRSGEVTKKLPVVIFTSSSEARDLERGTELGVNAYVRKPIDFAEYRETMKDIGRFWLLRNRIT